MKNKGCVYILTNPSFRNDWIKIGMSSRPISERLKELDCTSIPLPFEVYAILETSKYAQVEKLVHKTIDRLTNLRVRSSREFFNISPEEALGIFQDINLTLEDGEIKVFHKKDVQAESQNIKITRKPITQKNVWLIPGNKKFFDLEGCFKEFKGVYWKQRCSFEVNDIIYVYMASPINKVCYKLKVNKIDLPYNKFMDKQDKYNGKNVDATVEGGKYCYLSYISTNTSDSLKLDKIKEHGLKGILMGPRKISGELLKCIETAFQSQNSNS